MLSNILFMLFGAVLASIGFLGGALAERFRAPKLEQRPRSPDLTGRRAAPLTERRASDLDEPRVIEVSAREVVSNGSSPISGPARQTRQPVPVVQPLSPKVPVVQPLSPKAKPRTPPTKPETSTKDGEDVIASLTGAGFKKAIAAEAAWACTAAERMTIEGWTVAALRRCAQRT